MVDMAAAGMAAAVAGMVAVIAAATTVVGVGVAVGVPIGVQTTIPTGWLTAAGCACGFCAMIVGWCGASGAAGNG